ncbi:outer envelope pore protein 24A, chloroplastic [Elaeis guineensis]|uniref:Outer envelope pore protein 24A, chloroplastic n=1 Tax=Elaeis guineensis var. tenera TaxID=51953 RepID=A0A6I9RAG9_ELAGV|nr:outer envelope pore protein 24A, chloroplastic [Elaeis guineensis]
MKATVKGRYEVDKSSVFATVAVNAGDLKLKASMADATFVHGPSLNGLGLSVEKPGSFIIDYNVPKKDVRFQFMNSVRVFDKTVNLTYTHARADNRVGIDGSVAFDPANKVSVSYALGSGNCKVKYVYTHGVLRRTVLEPCYDVSKNSWDFAVTRKFEGGDSLRATYQMSSKNLGLEWNRESKINGSFKISTSFNLAEQKKVPKIIAESTWNYEM